MTGRLSDWTPPAVLDPSKLAALRAEQDGGRRCARGCRRVARQRRYRFLLGLVVRSHDLCPWDPSRDGSSLRAHTTPLPVRSTS